MMEQRPSPGYPNLSDLLYQQNIERLSDKFEGFGENDAPSSTEEEDSSQSAFGVDLTEKGTSLGGKSFTIAAILGLAGGEGDAMNLSVQERLQERRQLGYLYSHDVHALSDGFCRTLGVPAALRQDGPRPELRAGGGAQLKPRPHPMTCSSRSKQADTNDLHAGAAGAAGGRVRAPAVHGRPRETVPRPRAAAHGGAGEGVVPEPAHQVEEAPPGGDAAAASGAAEAQAGGRGRVDRVTDRDREGGRSRL